MYSQGHEDCANCDGESLKFEYRDEYTAADYDNVWCNVCIM